jgi:hypothetical protein
VNVGAERAAERQSVGSRLLLHNAPGTRVAGLHLDQTLNEFGPLDPRLSVNDASFAVEADDPLHRAHIEQHRVARELLPAHRVASAGDADRPPLLACLPDRFPEGLF